MQRLFSNLGGYLRLYHSKILPIFIIGIIVEYLFVLLLKKEYIKYKNNNRVTAFCGILLSVSIAVIIVMTLYGRTPGKAFDYSFQLFWSYRTFLRKKNVELLLQIIMNITMFVPIGFLLPSCFRKFEKNRFVFLPSFLASACIEIIQGITKIGMFEFDDIFGNVLGTEIGFLAWYVLKKVLTRIQGRKEVE